jgi:hypothetical protein
MKKYQPRKGAGICITLSDQVIPSAVAPQQNCRPLHLVKQIYSMYSHFSLKNEFV